MTRIAVIGAGFSGLSIAHLLKDYADITVFEKARGVSGRMSTRRADPYFFNHGAQYFSVSTKLFQNFLQPLLDQGIIEPWNAHHVEFKDKVFVRKLNLSDKEPRYVGVPTMNQVAKFLANKLHIHINTRIVSLSHHGTWQLTDEQNQQYSGFDWVICTAPAPQASELLPESFKYHTDIKAVKMLGCFAVMLGFEQSIPIEFETAHVTDSDVSWIAVNGYKTKRSDPFTLLVHSSEEYAEAHIDHDREKVMQHLIAEASGIIGSDVSTAAYQTIHRWRYANNAEKKQQISIYLDRDHKLAACGDWCLGGRVEDAFTSAYELAQNMKENGL